jgi:prephenate dehydrogenase
MDELPQHIGIVGLGLMGGSLARDLLRNGVSVTAHDPAAERLASAGDPVLRRIAFAPDVASVAAAPLVVIAVPVAAALHVLACLALHVTPSHVLLDVGSTKCAIVAHARSLGIGNRFVGCHPLVGDHRSGWAASREGMFTSVPVFLCPTDDTDRVALHTTCALWHGLGAHLEVESAEAHDIRMACVSHLPHAVSVALALALRDAAYGRTDLGPGGADMTRLAGGSTEVWRGIFVQNREQLVASLLAFERRLQKLRERIEAGDSLDVGRQLAEARNWFDAL